MTYSRVITNPELKEDITGTESGRGHRRYPCQTEIPTVVFPECRQDPELSSIWLLASSLVIDTVRETIREVATGLDGPPPTCGAKYVYFGVCRGLSDPNAFFLRPRRGVTDPEGSGWNVVSRHVSVLIYRRRSKPFWYDSGVC